MRIIPLLLSLTCTSFALFADMQENHSSTHAPKRFEAFCGKVTGHNVRMRLAPNLDAQVFKELDRDDLLLVTGIVDDFYACMPPKGLKGYIFRTYVLDGVVEGSNVFVRLGPDRTSPAVTQLNSGDLVKGTPSAQNSKWLEINLPEDVRFYVAKDYVQRVGDANYYTSQETRRHDAYQTLSQLENELDRELDRPFQKIQLSTISQKLSTFINDHKDMPQAVSQAEALISRMQQVYLTKSVALKDEPVEEQKQAAPKREKEQEKEIAHPPLPAPQRPVTTQASWQDHENSYIQSLIAKGEIESADGFYKEELEKTNTLHGTIKPYNSFVATRPGDFVLLNLKTNLPIAYLYSTKQDLATWVNKPVTLWVSERPNNNFAFPAYFVLQVEE